MKLVSLVVPVFNEDAVVDEFIRVTSDVLRRLPVGIDYEVIFVDDGSTDGTRDIVKSIPGIRFSFHEKNLGKGGALKTGIGLASGDLVLFQDADAEYDPNDYPAMLMPILDGRAQWTNGVRIPPKNDPRKGTISGMINRAGNWCITLFTNVLFLAHSEEYEGCYKVFSREFLQSRVWQSNSFDIDNEIVCTLLKQRIFPVDVPIHYTPRTYGEGKHIRLKHGVKILWTIARVRFFG